MAISNWAVRRVYHLDIVVLFWALVFGFTLGREPRSQGFGAQWNAISTQSGAVISRGDDLVVPSSQELDEAESMAERIR